MPLPKYQTDIQTNAESRFAIRELLKGRTLFLRSSSVSRQQQQNTVVVVDVLDVLSSDKMSVEHLLTLAVMLRPSGAANPPMFVLLATQTCSVNELYPFTLASPERTPTKWDGQSLTVYKCALLRFSTKGMTKYRLPCLYLLLYLNHTLSA